MLTRVAAFEFRYQIRSPLFAAASALFFALAFFNMAVFRLVSEPGGTVLFNAPHAIIKLHLVAALLFPFVGAAFVANAMLRDELTGFGPLVQATPVGKRAYLLGRFAGALAIGALTMCSATLGTWSGTLMPFANQAMLGANQAAGYAYGLGLFALPNTLIVFAILFALTSATRSTAGTFVGVVGVLLFYLVGQRLMEGQTGIQTARVLLDPLGMSAYMAASRYLTAAEINAGAVPVSGLMVLSRLVWMTLALGLLALTVWRFRFTGRPLSRRQQRKLAREQTLRTSDSRLGRFDSSIGRLPSPRFDRHTATAQFIGRARMEARFILQSAVFWILLLIALAFALPGLLTASTVAGTPVHPLTSVLVPILDDSFRTLLVVVAAYFGGELVWRERERRVDAIIDATPLPAWALMLPKMLGLAFVLLATLVVSAAVAMTLQAIDGSVAIVPADYLRWYLVPRGLDTLAVAALAVFIHAASPSKYAAWGILTVYFVLLILGPALGLAHPLLLYGSVPETPLSDLAGTGFSAEAAWWVRAFWAMTAALLLKAAHMLWPRGAAAPASTRFRRALCTMPDTARGAVLVLILAMLLCGTWVLVNTNLFNHVETARSTERYLAEYEKRYLRYGSIPQPVVDDIKLAVALYPEKGTAQVSGSYRLVNRTPVPIDTIHIRLADPALDLVGLEVPDSRLALDDRAFRYRIYRLTKPMRPSETRTIAFRTTRDRRGFGLSGGNAGVLPNGTELDAFALTPRIGMHDSGLLEDPEARRRMGLPRQRALPRLEDAQANARMLSDNAWISADITVSTSADQLAIAPGKIVEDRLRGGRRITRFVSRGPIQNNFSIQSGRFAVARRARNGIDYAIYYDPGHRWNVNRLMTAMEASIETFSRAFGPYQFDHVRAVEAAYRDGAHAYPGVIAMGEIAPMAMDLRDPGTIDMATMFAAHELSHQWWGHQVRGTRMEGAPVLIETLAQYSALMVLKQQRHGKGIDDLLAFQLDRYLKGRRAGVGGEEPLIRTGSSDQHIAYGKGALVLYLLQDQMGEEAVNRALRRLVARYRFSAPPYPRSVDLVTVLQGEARSPQQRQLIEDLFERVTLYDLQLGSASCMRRPDGRWDVTVPVDARKFYADGTGREVEAPLSISVDVLVTRGEGEAPGEALFDSRRDVRSGRQLLRFITKQEPTRVSIDPHGLYIDRNREDDLADVACSAR